MINPWIIDDEWTEDRNCAHKIRPWCVGELCFYCSHDASHKIEETSGPIGIHPVTAYVCCEHFFGNC